MGNPAWQKGKSGNPAGKPKGVQNKLTRDMREILFQAFEGTGGVKALIAWGKKANNRGEFYRLFAKMLPARLEGPDGEPLVLFRDYTGRKEPIEGESTPLVDLRDSTLQ